MEYIFDNPNQLPSLVIQARLRKIDPIANAVAYATEREDENGNPSGVFAHYVSVQSVVLSEAQIELALSTAQTASEISAFNDFMAAVAKLENTPNYWDDTVEQLKAQNNTFWFDGQTRAQVIESLSAITNVGIRTALTAIVNTLYDIKNNYVNRAIEMDVITRDYLLRLRR